MKKLNLDIISVLFGGFCSLFLGMGISRFVYTPILPLMQREFSLSDFISGSLASVNLFGYLLGAIFAITLKDNSKKFILFRISVVISVITISLMVFESVVFWFLVRFWAGFCSALILIYGSDFVINYLIKSGFGHLSGFIFSGIGIGMVMSGMTIPFLGKFFSSSKIWLLMGLLSILPAIVVYATVPKTPEQTRQMDTCQDIKGNNLPVKLVTIAYFLEGFGYIITGTFVSALVYRVEGSSFLSGLVWVVVGLGASIFTPLWGILGKKVGNVLILVFLYFLQCICVALPLIKFSYLYLFISALGLGGTFLGIVSLSFVVAKEITNIRNTTSVLTIFFSFGQILGPIIGGYLADKTRSFYSPIALASLSIFLGGIIMIFLYILQRRRYASYYS
ncbi:MAG: YbfB/YjiJ family MFS transporter [Calditerrivibrio sp.]|nr:YbfB/YjiJ family MFS transporter [Calditerrivibrio sp.]